MSSLSRPGNTVMKRVVISLCAVGLLGACRPTESMVAGSAPSFPTTAILDMASVINTQKTVDDHLVSWITGKDCSTVRASMGEHYCRESPPVLPMVQRTTYCYKSLALVTCYDQPVERDAARLFGTRVDQVPPAGR